MSATRAEPSSSPPRARRAESSSQPRARRAESSSQPRARRAEDAAVAAAEQWTTRLRPCPHGRSSAEGNAPVRPAATGLGACARADAGRERGRSQSLHWTRWRRSRPVRAQTWSRSRRRAVGPTLQQQLQRPPRLLLRRRTCRQRTQPPCRPAKTTAAAAATAAAVPCPSWRPCPRRWGSASSTRSSSRATSWPRSRLRATSG